MKQIVILIVHAYRLTLGPLLGGQCRFHPTCSQYMIDAVNKHGAFRGGWRGVKRVCRCHPLTRGGIDPA